MINGGTKQRERFTFIETERFFPLLGMFLLFGFSMKNNLAHLTLRNAVGGFSPVDYIQIITKSEEFVRHFPSGIENLRTSLIFRLYEAAYSFGIEPEAFQRFVIVFSVAFFAFSLLYLSKSLFSKALMGVYFLIILLGLGTDLLNHDLARVEITACLAFGQMYGIADSFSIFAIAFALRGLWAACWTAIGLTFLFHPSIALYAGLICGTLSLIELRPLRKRSYWLGVGIGSSLVLGWFLITLVPALSDFPSMSTTNWIDWARFGNAHWFPFSLQVFKQEHFRRITPLLALLILALSDLREDSAIDTVKKSKWIVFIITIMTMTVIGLMSSLYVRMPVVIKLSLHRSSSFLLVLSLPLAASLLWRDVGKGKYLALVALVLLFNPVIGRVTLLPLVKGMWGFPLIFAMLRGWYALRSGCVGSQNTCKSIAVILWGLFFTAFLHTLYLLFFSHVRWEYKALLGTPEVLILCIFFSVVIFFLERKIAVFSQKTLSFFLSCLLLVFALGGIIKSENQRIPWGNVQKATAYYEVQRWAKENTPRGSLFMVDPNIEYGWVAYSERPKFGSFREWIHTNWLYTGNQKFFDEGRRRLRLLGLEPDDYLLRSLQEGKTSVGPEYWRLVRDVGQAFYTMNGEMIEHLITNEGVEYFLFDKTKKTTVQSPPIFENKFFSLHRAPNRK